MNLAFEGLGSPVKISRAVLGTPQAGLPARYSNSSGSEETGSPDVVLPRDVQRLDQSWYLSYLGRLTVAERRSILTVQLPADGICAPGSACSRCGFVRYLIDQLTQPAMSCTELYPDTGFPGVMRFLGAHPTMHLLQFTWPAAVASSAGQQRTKRRSGSSQLSDSPAEQQQDSSSCVDVKQADQVPGHLSATGQGAGLCGPICLQDSLLQDGHQLARFMEHALQLARQGVQAGGVSCAGTSQGSQPQQIQELGMKLRSERTDLQTQLACAALKRLSCSGSASSSSSQPGAGIPAPGRQRGASNTLPAQRVQPGAEFEAEAAALSAIAAAERLQSLAPVVGSGGGASSSSSSRSVTPPPASPSTCQHSGAPSPGASGAGAELSVREVQQLEDQLITIDQRLRRLSHAWEQGLQAASSKLMQMLATCCWQRVVSQCHLALGRVSWEQLLCEPDLESPLTPWQPPFVYTREDRQMHQQRIDELVASLAELGEAVQGSHERESVLNALNDSQKVMISSLMAQLTKQQQEVDDLRQRLAWSEAEPAALEDSTADRLGSLLEALEQRLARAKRAYLQASARQEQMCAVCLERHKAMVFQCGHQTCCECADALAQCPFCRSKISLRIKLY